ncbi:MAG: DUF3987 domain-containing protein [Ruminococcus sp.]|nr:DUF3987 domain-containing protein [Ruminococcus sp.]
MTFTIQLDRVHYADKPKKEVSAIKNRLAETKPEQINAKDFAKEVCNGASFTPAILQGGAKAENWTAQQLFAVDIDNEDKTAPKSEKRRAEKPLTIDEVKRRCTEWDVYPVLIYETFSSSVEWQKFRIVFAANRVITDGAERDCIQLAFMELFPECDPSCKNRDRLFFGGKRALFFNKAECCFEPAAIMPLGKAAADLEHAEKMFAELDRKSSSPELDDLKRRFDFLGYIRQNYSVTEKRSGNYIVLNPCPICGHKDDFVFYPQTNSFKCFSTSGDVGGTIIDFLMYTRKFDRAQAVSFFKEELCGIRPSIERNGLSYEFQSHIEKAAREVNQEQRSTMFTNIINAARTQGTEQQALQFAKGICRKEHLPELWELPKSFDESAKLPKLTDSCLPPKLWEYLQAVAKYVQVAPEMCVLPLLSVLSMCVQGKAVISYPANAHTEPLNLYTMTIAAPGERKSGCFKEFMNPVVRYQREYNQSRRLAVRNYQTKKVFLERQRDNAMKGQKADLKKAQEFDKQLAELEEVHELRLVVEDVTPEALAAELAGQGERTGILDDEGTAFDTLSGIYSSGQVNINIFLKAYDGAPYTIARRTSPDIELVNPLLTMGLMVQPAHYAEAMSNKQFSGRGFIHRFMFAFPEPMTGHLKFESPNIDLNLQTMYHDLVRSLLVIPYPKDKLPVIFHSREARLLFEDYFEHLQREMQQGGRFENMKEWANKQFARALRVAGIFHMAEHKGYIADKPLSGENAAYAIALALWEEQQAFHALSGEGTESETVRNAKLILEKLKGLEVSEITKGELLSKAVQNFNANDLQEPLELLADLNYIRIIEQRNGQKGRPKVMICINPNIKK